MGLTLDEPKKDETSNKVNGINVLIAPEIRAVADDNRIDYVTSSYGEGFSIMRSIMAHARRRTSTRGVRVASAGTRASASNPPVSSTR